jgi:HemY protein
VMDESASIEAREAAIEANKLSPDLIPAAAMAARGYAEKGDKRSATRVLKKAWEVMPHPDLAAAFAAIEPDETPTERLKRFRTLTTLRADSDETKMLLAELLMAAEDFPAARRALGDVPNVNPTQRSLALLAAIARGEGAEDAVVRDLVAKALTAPRGPQWICESCNAIHTSWHPVCDNCGAFDTLAWRPPPATGTPSRSLAELLPLIESRSAPLEEPEPEAPPEPDPVPPDEIARRGA